MYKYIPVFQPIFFPVGGSEISTADAIIIISIMLGIAVVFVLFLFFFDDIVDWFSYLADRFKELRDERRTCK